MMGLKLTGLTMASLWVKLIEGVLVSLLGKKTAIELDWGWAVQKDVDLVRKKGMWLVSLLDHEWVLLKELNSAEMMLLKALLLVMVWES